MSAAVMSQDSDLSRIVRASFAPAESQPPVEAERALLGALLLSPDRALPEVRGILEATKDPFAVGQHREVWTAIVDLADSGKPVDPATVTEYLRAHGGPLAPNAEQVSALTDSAPTSCHAPAYARDVAAAARARDAERTAALLAGCLRNGDTADAAALAARVVELTTGSADEGLVPSDILGAPEPPEPLFRNGPPPGTFGVLLGDSGLGKSHCVLTLAVSSATGFTVWPSFAPARPLRVAVVAAEDSREIVRKRLLTLCAYSRVPQNALREAFNEGRLAVFNDMGTLFTLSENGAVVQTAAYEKLRQWVRQNKPDVLFLDPLASIMEIQENDNGSMNAIAQELARLAESTGCAVVVSHHVNKLSAAAGGRADQHAARGGSALTCRSRWVALLAREDRKGLFLGIVKNSYGPGAHVALERTEHGALVEVDTRRNAEQAAHELVQWLRDNPRAAVTESGIRNQRNAGRELTDALDWTPAHALEALKTAEAHRLVRREQRTPEGGGRAYEAIVPTGTFQSMGEVADNDCPF
ncbi:MAG: AAA family ATPase [Candidatus Hydrogenedentes bacterium]|nr:AAA family ATPase [Candidatus Hydrogenedentota bacterium]